MKELEEENLNEEIVELNTEEENNLTGGSLTNNYKRSYVTVYLTTTNMDWVEATSLKRKPKKMMGASPVHEYLEFKVENCELYVRLKKMPEQSIMSFNFEKEVLCRDMNNEVYIVVVTALPVPIIPRF